MRFPWQLPSILLNQLDGKLQTMVGRKFPYYVLLFTVYFLLFTAPAQAAKLQFWRFNTSQNQLEFTTDDGVQPRAQLISNPTRLVIDLPGTTLGRPAIAQSYSGAITAVRVAQFDRETTRLVIELAPNYTIDPQQVKFRGIAPNQWTVQLPTPQLVTQTPGSGNPEETNVPAEPTDPIPTSVAGAATQIQAVQVTPDGLFVRTGGQAARLKVQRSRDRRQITIEFPETNVTTSLLNRNIPINQHRISQLRVIQTRTSPATAQIVLNVNPDSADWQASNSSLGGVVLLPSAGGVASNPTPPSPRQPDIGSGTPTPSRVATIQSVDLENNNQLVIRSDQAITYTSGWDRATAAYRITLSPAQLAENIQGPKLGRGSPLLRVRLRQEDPRTVSILVQPASGIRIGELNQPRSEVLALQLQNSRPGAGNPPGSISIPPPQNPSPQPFPTVPKGKIVVVVDPGHGGPDPGAIGIGGLQEKGIVLDIGQQVASLLEQQGVQAVLTRSNDIDLDLEPRVQLAERINATVFVSIHANAISLSRPDISGLETYYFSSGDQLARTIHNSILQGTGAKDRGVRQARFYVLRKTSMPAVLIEVGFVTGQDDAAKLSTSAYRRRMAEAIVRGILQYIRQNP